MTEDRRTHEPFVKAQFALWLLQQGASRVVVSIDGAEPDPHTARDVLLTEGFVREPIKSSAVDWTGTYSHDDCEVMIWAKPGIDISATMPDGVWIAECKGEPTKSGIASGADLTALYTCLGQLMRRGGEDGLNPKRLFIAVPKGDRLAATYCELAANCLVRRVGIEIALVDEDGRVDVICP